jgi:hypothetical protein
MAAAAGWDEAQKAAELAAYQKESAKTYPACLKK